MIQGLIHEFMRSGAEFGPISYLPTPFLRETGPRMGHVPNKLLSRYCATGECAAGISPNITPLSHAHQATQAADFAGGVSTWAGKVSADAGIAGNVRVAVVAAAIGLGAALFEQAVRPNAPKAANDSVVDGIVGLSTGAFPILAPAFTEIGDWLKANNYLGYPIFR